jgi:cellulose synthase/poly-beta-1,6-N-acetylglucosamine synthase-like glycosyltransferase
MTWSSVLVVVSQLLTAIAIVTLVPASVLLLQVLAARVRARDDDWKNSEEQRPSIAVLVPAHDESAGIAATLRSIQAQLAARDRLLVVADNCSDDTARVAAECGAEVLERFDAQRRGKGYALDFGIRHLEAAPPEVVLMIDADCQVHPGSLDCLARVCSDRRRPVQALYLMHSPTGAAFRLRVAEFAWMVRNQVRPLGYRRLGLPCQLMGTGMAFPWELIRRAPLASGHIVEDLRLGLDLAAAGAPPLFCPRALVTSVFALHPQGAADQRARWEEGHVGVITHEVPRMLWRALIRSQRGLAAMALDICVPPLTILVLLLIAQVIVDALNWIGGGAGIPLGLAATALAMVMIAVLGAWSRFGRSVVTLGELVGAPLYVIAKLPMYARFFRRGKREWVRARRDERDE